MTFVALSRKMQKKIDLDNSDIGVWVAPDYRGLPRAKGRFLLTFSLLFWIKLCQLSMLVTVLICRQPKLLLLQIQIDVKVVPVEQYVSVKVREGVKKRFYFEQVLICGWVMGQES